MRDPGVTAYRFSVSEPGEDEPFIAATVDSLSEIPTAFLLLGVGLERIEDLTIELLAERVSQLPNVVPLWRVVAVEDDGEERSLDATEKAALVSAFEQAWGGPLVRLVPADDDEDGDDAS